MINVSNVIHHPDFERDIVIERTTGGHYEGPDYKSTKQIITVKGVIVTPKNSREINQTEHGDILTGFVKIYVDASTPIYVTQNQPGQNNISDVVIDAYQTAMECRYRILSTFDRSQWGVIEAEGQREGAG